MAEGSLIVVALGGNAISRETEEGNVDQQFANSSRTASALADLIDAGHQLVITHGNGPQIGNFLLRNEAAKRLIYPLPMEVAVAHVQGGMGYMIAQTLMNELHRRGAERVVSTVITNVLVNADDPSFADPTKPIGRVLTPEDVETLHRKENWRIKEVAPGKYRRVVASPRPVRILEMEHIRRSVAAGEILIVCGGGGIPVVRDANGDLKGARAVIDKDLATALLATELDADIMMVLTGIDRVRINFGKPDEQPLDSLTIEQARRHLADGQFPPGSMGPKVEGAVTFLEGSAKPEACVVIGPLERANDAICGRIGTRITRT